MGSDPRSRQILLVPGLFGFGQLLGYDYFGHLKEALQRQYRRRSSRCEVITVDMAPTGSLRRRAARLGQQLAKLPRNTSVHLIGHSTGGLDCRLALHTLHESGELPPQAKSLISLNTPHRGSPLATYFTTSAGGHALYALSLLTVLTLALGDPSLGKLSSLLRGLGRLDRWLGDAQVFRRLTGRLLRFVDREARQELTTYLNQLQEDRGALIQTTPEAMDVFRTTVQDVPRLCYGCVASAARPRTLLGAPRRFPTPGGAVRSGLFRAIHQLSSRSSPRYPSPVPPPSARAYLEQRLGAELDARTNDGVVPTLSMLHGQCLWAGPADHLDVLGHFGDTLSPSAHVDWMTSRAAFGRQQFEQMANALVTFQLASEKHVEDS